MILRTIRCAVCGKTHTEAAPNVGFPGWGAVHGVELNGEANPTLCPEHLASVMNYIEELKNGVD